MGKKKVPDPIDQSTGEYVLCVVGTPTIYLKPYSPQFGWTMGKLVDAKCMSTVEDAQVVQRHAVNSTNGSSFTMLEVCRITKIVHRLKETV